MDLLLEALRGFLDRVLQCFVVHVGHVQQLLCQLPAGPVQAALNGGDGNLQLAGDLGVGLPLQVVEAGDGTLVAR